MLDRKVSIAMREKRDAQRRGDVFAESIQFDDDYQPNTVPKPEDTMQRIKEALGRNALMSIVSELDIDVMAGFMVSKKFDRGDVVINEGDTGDFFYVVESGTYDVSIAGGVVGTVKVGGSFGELALLYNCPRAATVTTTDSGVLWALDRVTFRWIVARNAEDQLDECKKFLRNSWRTCSFRYARAPVIHPLCVKMQLKSDDSWPQDGEYFGERALMTHEPRAANVTAETDVVAFALDRQAFDEILGSLREVIDRNMSMRVIQSVPILKSLLPSSLATLFAALTAKTFNDGERVITEGAPGTTFYIIKTGHAIVSKASGSSIFAIASSTVVEIAKLSVGDYFGEMALLNDEPRKANVVASGTLECFVLERAK
ncbi:hypothetical protein B5M09_006562, partial [Aphanomyces astaci]